MPARSSLRLPHRLFHQARRLHASAPSAAGSTPPIFELRQHPRFAQPWVVHENEAWAIVGPAVEAGGQFKSQLVKLVLGRWYAPGVLFAHPFLRGSHRTPSQAVQHVAFTTRGSGSNVIGSTSGGAGKGGEFFDYSARYGAIRTEDQVTLYESLMEQLGVFTGHVAKMRVCPDPLAPDEGRDVIGKVKWASEEARIEAVQQARETDALVRTKARTLNLDGELLHRPLIALSNGQTRRARILSALLAGGECIVMDEPYTGLDPETRGKVSHLLSSLHTKREPRVMLVLREQDSVPDFVTHVLRVGEEGQILHLGSVAKDEGHGAGRGRHPSGGYEVVKSNAARGVGIGYGTPLVEMQGVQVSHRGNKILSDINMQIQPGSRTVLVGDNGSGKTTLLSLILGDHPLSYAFPASKLSLFGAARRDQSNATAKLKARMGHFSPELFNAFPRRSLDKNGHDVMDAISSGFDNVFVPRNRTEKEQARVYGLLQHFADLIRNSSGPGSSQQGQQEDSAPSTIEELAKTPFLELSAGSQALILFLRAVVHSPQLLVLDEPFQGMDRKQVERARRFLDEAGTDADSFLTGSNEEERERDRKARKEMAMVVVSHYEEEWPVTCGRLIRLKAGEVVKKM